MVLLVDVFEEFVEVLYGQISRRPPRRGTGRTPWPASRGGLEGHVGLAMRVRGDVCTSGPGRGLCVEGTETRLAIS